jgi:hypothetical protein
MYNKKRFQNSRFQDLSDRFCNLSSMERLLAVFFRGSQSRSKAVELFSCLSQNKNNYS